LGRWFDSNCKLEGLNSKIRLINHRGYGHHSAAAVIAMIYLCCSSTSSPPLSGPGSWAIGAGVSC
jgi:Transposase